MKNRGIVISIIFFIAGVTLILLANQFGEQAARLSPSVEQQMFTAWQVAQTWKTVGWLISIISGMCFIKLINFINLEKR